MSWLAKEEDYLVQNIFAYGHRTYKNKTAHDVS